MTKTTENILRIETASIGQVKVVLKGGAEEIVVEKKQQFGSQVLLNMIEKILKNGGVEMKDLKGIEVNTGPGSFTGIRVGVSVANALGFSLKIPVNGKQMETELKYQ